jgi:hypothetical protein
MLPTPDRWTLVVSKEPSGFHTTYNSFADFGRVELTKRTVPDLVEQLTFAIVKSPAAADVPKTDVSGSITMTWETTEVSVPFTVE